MWYALAGCWLRWKKPPFKFGKVDGFDLDIWAKVPAHDFRLEIKADDMAGAVVAHHAG